MNRTAYERTPEKDRMPVPDRELHACNGCDVVRELDVSVPIDTRVCPACGKMGDYRSVDV